MGYCSLSDIQLLINGNDWITFMDDSNTGDPNAATTAINSLIGLMSARIDGRLANIYTVPFSPTPPFLRDACSIFVCEAMYQRRLTPDERNPFRSQADEIRERLTLIGNGKLELDLNFPRNFTQVNAIQIPIAMNVTSL